MKVNPEKCHVNLSSNTQRKFTLQMHQLHQGQVKNYLG